MYSETILSPGLRRLALRERLAAVIAADRAARVPERVVRCRALLAMRSAACRAIDAARARRAAARIAGSTR